MKTETIKEALQLWKKSIQKLRDAETPEALKSFFGDPNAENTTELFAAIFKEEARSETPNVEAMLKNIFEYFKHNENKAGILTAMVRGNDNSLDEEVIAEVVTILQNAFDTSTNFEEVEDRIVEYSTAPEKSIPSGDSSNAIYRSLSKKLEEQLQQNQNTTNALYTLLSVATADPDLRIVFAPILETLRNKLSSFLPEWIKNPFKARRARREKQKAATAQAATLVEASLQGASQQEREENVLVENILLEIQSEVPELVRQLKGIMSLSTLDIEDRRYFINEMTTAAVDTVSPKQDEDKRALKINVLNEVVLSHLTEEVSEKKEQLAPEKRKALEEKLKPELEKKLKQKLQREFKLEVGKEMATKLYSKQGETLLPEQQQELEEKLERELEKEVEAALEAALEQRLNSVLEEALRAANPVQYGFTAAQNAPGRNTVSASKNPFSSSSKSVKTTNRASLN